MSDLRKAAEMALACLDKAIAYSKNEIKQQDDARLALRQALAQPDTDLQEAIKKGTKAWAGVDPTKWVEELRGDDTKCKDHPDAPHSFDRNASLTEDRYVCECEYWEPPVDAVNMSQERVDETAKHKHELTDWEAVAADQAMTIAMLKIEQREIWNKAWDAGYEAGLNNQEKETT
jgi:hypothetical protein